MLKAEFDVMTVKPVSHVGLYKGKNKDLIVFFSNEKNCREGIVIRSDICAWSVGDVCNSFISCLDELRWEKLDSNSVTFTW